VGRRKGVAGGREQFTEWEIVEKSWTRLKTLIFKVAWVAGESPMGRRPCPSLENGDMVRLFLDCVGIYFALAMIDDPGRFGKG